MRTRRKEIAKAPCRPLRRDAPTYPLYIGQSTLSGAGNGAFADADIEEFGLIGRWELNNVVSWDHCISCARMLGPLTDQDERQVSRWLQNMCIVGGEHAAFREGVIQAFCCTTCDLLYTDSPVRVRLDNSITIQANATHTRSTVLLMDTAKLTNEGKVFSWHTSPRNSALRYINESPGNSNCMFVDYHSYKNTKRDTVAVIIKPGCRVTKGSELILDTYGPNYDNGMLYERIETTQRMVHMVDNYVMTRTYGGAFTPEDCGKQLQVSGETVWVDGEVRAVKWNAAVHFDCKGIIKDVQPMYLGTVTVVESKDLELQTLKFENGDGIITGPHQVAGWDMSPASKPFTLMKLNRMANS